MNNAYDTYDMNREQINFEAQKIVNNADRKNWYRDDVVDILHDNLRKRRGIDYNYIDEYDDVEIREEIDSLRNSLNRLKKALDERKGDNVDIKMAVKSLEQSTCESFTNVADSLREINDRINVINEEYEKKLDQKLEKTQAAIHNDLDEMNMPISAKCETLEEQLELIQKQVDDIKKAVEEYDYTEVLERVDHVEDSVKNSFLEKFGSKTIGNVLQKLGLQQSFLIANAVGIIMLMVLMGYFIFSLT